jgi:hypothetical protein
VARVRARPQHTRTRTPLFAFSPHARCALHAARCALLTRAPPRRYDTIKGADWLGDQDAIQVRVAPA